MKALVVFLSFVVAVGVTALSRILWGQLGFTSMPAASVFIGRVCLSLCVVVVWVLVVLTLVS